MSTISETEISSFGSPVEHHSSLEALISQIVSRETEALRIELELSRSEIRGLQDRCRLLEDDNQALRDGLKAAQVYSTPGRVDDLFEISGELEGRIAKLEGIPKAHKQESRLKRLDAILYNRGNEPLTFAEIGKLLELGSRTEKKNTRPQAMTKLGKVLEAESKRYIVFDSKTQAKARMVRLTPDYFKHLGMV